MHARVPGVGEDRPPRAHGGRRERDHLPFQRRGYDGHHRPPLRRSQLRGADVRALRDPRRAERHRRPHEDQALAAQEHAHLDARPLASGLALPSCLRTTTTATTAAAAAAAVPTLSSPPTTLLTPNHPLHALLPIPPLRPQWEAYHMSASLQRIAFRLDDYHGKWHHLLLLSRNNEMPHGDMELMFRLEQASAARAPALPAYTPTHTLGCGTGANGARRGRCGGRRVLDPLLQRRVPRYQGRQQAALAGVPQPAWVPSLFPFPPFPSLPFPPLNSHSHPFPSTPPRPCMPRPQHARAPPLPPDPL